MADEKLYVFFNYSKILWCDLISKCTRYTESSKPYFFKKNPLEKVFFYSTKNTSTNHNLSYTELSFCLLFNSILLTHYPLKIVFKFIAD